MRRFIDRLASLPIILIGGAAEAAVMWVPCDYTIPAPPLAHIAEPVHFAPPHVKRHVAHRGGRRGVMHALHAVAARSMCPIWVTGGLVDGGDVGPEFGHQFGDSDLADDETGTGYGPERGDVFLNSGGGGFVGGDTASGFLAFTQPVGGFDLPNVPITPPCLDCAPTPTPTPIPEPSTVWLCLAGFAALALLKLRRAA